MASGYISVDVSGTPALEQLAEALRKTGKTHVLKQGAETVAVVRPVRKKARPAGSRRRPSRRGRVFTMDDPLWSIVGIAQGTGHENVSGNVDAYLAEAHADERQ